MSNKWLDNMFDYKMKGRAFYFDKAGNTKELPKIDLQNEEYNKSKELVFKNISTCKSIRSIKALGKYLSEGSEGLKEKEEFKNFTGDIVEFTDMFERWDLIPDKNNLVKGKKEEDKGKDEVQYRNRQAYHLMISLPEELKKVSREKIDEVMVDFLEPLQNFNPVYVQHRHQNHAHVHIILPARSEDKQDRIHFSRDFTRLMKMHAAGCCLDKGLEVTVSSRKISKRIKEDIEKELNYLDKQDRPRFDKTTRKVNLEKQTPIWYERHCLDYQARRTGNEIEEGLQPVIYKIPELDKRSEENLDKWVEQVFEEPEKAKNIFKEMLAEKTATTFWYANNRPEVFGNTRDWDKKPYKITQRDIYIKDSWKQEVTDFFEDNKEHAVLIEERKHKAGILAKKHTSYKYDTAIKIAKLDYTHEQQHKQRRQERSQDLERDR